MIPYSVILLCSQTLLLGWKKNAIAGHQIIGLNYSCCYHAIETTAIQLLATKLAIQIQQSYLVDKSLYFSS